jgi:replicative superfamily II helicase
MSKEVVVIGGIQKRKPEIMGDVEYDAITNLFSQGLSREEVIKKMNFDKSWYYRRLGIDPSLKLAEQRGYDMVVGNLSKDIAVGVKKGLLGHTFKKTKKLYEWVDQVDENGVVERVKVLKSVVEEDVYYPPNAAIVNAVGRQVIASMKESDDTTLEIEKRMSELSDEDIQTMHDIANKVISSK